MPGHATTRFIGIHRCVQVYLSPLGAYRLLGLPGHEFARRVVNLNDLTPLLGGSLPDRLGEAPSWADRITLVEQALLSVLDAGPKPEALVAWMWNRIRDCGGRTWIDELVTQTGRSHRHATTRFRSQVGLPPKAAAGVVRFERAAAEIGLRPLAELAAEHGFADQSRLTREVPRYSGEPPREFLAARRPTTYTALGADPC